MCIRDRLRRATCRHHGSRGQGHRAPRNRGQSPHLGAGVVMGRALAVIAAVIVLSVPSHALAANHAETRPIPLENRAGKVRTDLSGVRIQQPGTTMWYLYPGALSLI